MINVEVFTTSVFLCVLYGMEVRSNFEDCSQSSSRLSFPKYICSSFSYTVYNVRPGCCDSVRIVPLLPAQIKNFMGQVIHDPQTNTAPL